MVEDFDVEEAEQKIIDELEKEEAEKRREGEEGTEGCK